MAEHTCATCAYWGDGMAFSAYGMDFCCREDSVHYNDLTNSDSYCKAWEPKAECGGCQYWDGDDGRCRNPESEYYESTMRGEEWCDEWGEREP